MKTYMMIAIDATGGFGKEGKIPWHYPEDLKKFKETTQGAYCIMGRNTYEDMATYFNGEILLPGRYPIVISKTLKSSRYTNVDIFPDINSALENIKLREYAEGNKDYAYKVFFIGGKSIYDYALDHAEVLFVTKIPKIYNCDTYLDLEKLDGNFKEVASEQSKTGQLTYSIYKRL